MNIQLEKLFEKHNFSQKDRYDFQQIYNLLPSHKKVKVVERFDEINLQLNALRDNLYTEQEILFGEALKNIEQRLSQINKKRVVSESKHHIDLLKQII